MKKFENINYDNCITNLTSSIQKHFGLTPNYKTNEIADRLLAEKDYDNVIIFVFDGMGNSILEKNTTKAHFLLSHKVGEMFSTFPPTTANCTTAYVSGLNPIETGWLGWSTYYEDLKKTIDNFPNVDSFTLESVGEVNIANTKLAYTPLGNIIEKETNGEVSYHCIMPPFVEGGAKSLDDLFHRVIKRCNEPGKKYFYVYWHDPDGILHKEGTVSKHVKECLNKISKGLRNVERKTKNTIGFVSADHSQIDVTPIAFYTYYDINECLRTPFSCDSRCPFFFLKDGCEEKFVSLFNKYFGDYYDLYTKKEILDLKVFGPGKEHPLYQSIIGDYVAIAKDRYYFMLSPLSHVFKGHHAGGLVEESSIPLIVIKN